MMVFDQLILSVDLYCCLVSRIYVVFINLGESGRIYYKLGITPMATLAVFYKNIFYYFANTI